MTVNQVYFRFYAELNDFLRPDRRMKPMTQTFDHHPAVKDAIEALGVPHTEVDLILVQGESVPFDYLLQHQDRVSVYPMFEAIDITPLLRVRPKPLRDTRFILDVHLGKLTRYLRLLGFDSLYRNDYQDAELVQIAYNEKRILLTRDLGLLKRNLVTHGYFLRETHPKSQLREILHRFDLFRVMIPFQRCINCNGFVYPVHKSVVHHQIPIKIIQYYHEFYRCQVCQKIYWKGSHYQKMQRFIKEMIEKEER